MLDAVPQQEGAKALSMRTGGVISPESPFTAWFLNKGRISIAWNSAKTGFS
jgi:hypothetical protein